MAKIEGRGNGAWAQTRRAVWNMALQDQRRRDAPRNQNLHCQHGWGGPLRGLACELVLVEVHGVSERRSET